MIIPWQPLLESPYGIPFHASTDDPEGSMGCLYLSDQLVISILIDDEIPEGLSIIKEGSYDNVRLRTRWSKKEKKNIGRYLLVPNYL